MRLTVVMLCIAVLIGGCRKKPLQPPPQGPETESPAQESPPPAASQPPPESVPQERPKVPSVVAELTEAPLDVLPACTENGCRLILLFANRICVLSWQDGQKKEIQFSESLFGSIRSRAPSGKIMKFAKGYLILNQNLANPLYFTDNFDSPPGAYSERPDWLPIPEPGVNWYTLQDGRFYDFEPIPESGLAVIDTTYTIQIGRGGKLVPSTVRCGATLCSLFPVLYTSSPVNSDEPDAVMKFRAREDSVVLETIRPVQGNIVDLAISDLNQDGVQELLVTLKTAKGFMVEAMDVF